MGGLRGVGKQLRDETQISGRKKLIVDCRLEKSVSYDLTI